jgi:hypothetical protein
LASKPSQKEWQLNTFFGNILSTLLLTTPTTQQFPIPTARAFVLAQAAGIL